MVRAWHFKALDVDAAWGTYKTRGAGVTVALIDTGVANIEPLAHVRRFSADGLERPAKGHDLSPVAHGTQTASIIASRNESLLGVAPDSNYLAFGVANAAGDPLSSLVGRAMRAAVKLEADLICCPFTLAESTEEFAAGLAAARAAQIPVIAAAGNDARAAPVFPVEADEVLVVGATSGHDRIVTRFRWEAWMPVSAPGLRVPTWTGRGDISRMFSGTSAATPIIGGIAALGLSYAMSLDPTGEGALAVRQRLSSLLRDSSRPPADRRLVDPGAFMAAIATLVRARAQPT
ncbi:putative secreted serine protease [Enhygromyxa salina]|uniref:Putative secreted serine protease n=1 Tax=Enhygromyxa salina TaxID=215803 RepID=A0A0C1ZW90_9BACT|nr:S8/S53 family peptidase [Enhygromyxa salina]KIG15308.1 putative secreted serine protease [Enhygromyxa salina]